MTVSLNVIHIFRGNAFFFFLLRNRVSTPQLEFPMRCLAPTMMELYLANNDLKAVPHGISDLEKLLVLDLGG